MDVSYAELKKHIKTFPQTPGVYLMKDHEGMVLYVGKAARLRSRVSSYFQQRSDAPKIEVLKKKVHTVEYVSTPTEVEALLCEAHLIGLYNPKYNTLLKDNKSFPLLKITGEQFPRVIITRNKSERNARYYGPYTDVAVLRTAVQLIHTIFPIRKCRVLPRRPCLYYYIKQCIAPCIYPAVQDEYTRLIGDIESFLKGDRKSFVEYVTRRMHDAAVHFRYEEADMFKKQLYALQHFRKKSCTLADPRASYTLSGTSILKKLLHLKKLPERIVCFDVSTIQGTSAVASKVSFYREIPDKHDYRRYKIRTVHEANDYAMIEEAVSRMIESIAPKGKEKRPDLMVIDGGKGHLHTVTACLEKRGASIPCISIAKKCEEVYAPFSEGPLPLSLDSPAVNLIRRIRDEAHRFAISYHRVVRSKQMASSPLDEISGIGPVRKKKLLQYFGSLKAMQEVSVSAIQAVSGCSNEVARGISDRVRTLYKKEDATE